MENEAKIEITPEIKDALQKAQSADEIVALARERGVDMSAEEAARAYAALHETDEELADEELAGVAGGGFYYYRSPLCPVCGWDDVKLLKFTHPDNTGTFVLIKFECQRCRHVWEEDQTNCTSEV